MTTCPPPGADLGLSATSLSPSAELPPYTASPQEETSGSSATAASSGIHLTRSASGQGWALRAASSWSEGSVPYQATTGIRHSAQPTTSMPTAITENATIAGPGRKFGPRKAAAATSGIHQATRRARHKASDATGTARIAEMKAGTVTAAKPGSFSTAPSALTAASSPATCHRHAEIVDEYKPGQCAQAQHSQQTARLAIQSPRRRTSPTIA
jgi:hypothetical protein